ncbi:signal peptidase II [Pseudomonas sp. DTU_2021_1001937_2_SI_NGA_ILE_001]|uniref:signal peptidase II n=1 Tax=Pseudomonas sp. DTU_2021_1001937_2_SI_NGA_ILE_001 TaxID=3077589 RepID=UPI0028FC0DB2|nr:signal peptidase II [Pseudomonas sp. DTU_2021_1001937_2_SI_NGA_ILE_001]WNW10185.1 signal peptidase II [Pseudomonas sp. DTU_2021_1001937_2_SI_NGA_ILE_001]
MRQLLRAPAFALVAGVLFILFDQWVKLVALTRLAHESLRYGSSSLWLDVALSLNPGAFLSLGAGLPLLLKQAIFVIAVGLVVAWAIRWSLSHWSIATAKAAAVYLIALGGASNLFDRVYRDGHVVDYLVLNLGSLHTGVFNIADMAIMAGAFYLIVEGLRRPSQA